MTLHDWRDLLVRHRWLILMCVALVAIPVAIYVSLKPSLYQASSIILVQRDQSALASVMPTDGPLSRTDRRLGNEILVLNESLPLARYVATRLLELGRVPETREPLTILQTESGRRPTVAEVIQRLEDYFVASPEGRDVDAIRVTSTSTVPGEAALIANLVAESYLRRTKENSRASHTAAREFLETQMNQTQRLLEEREASLRSFMTSEGAVNLDEASSQIVEQVAALEAQRDEANIEMQARRASADARRRELDAIQPRLAQRISSGVDEEIRGLQNLLATAEQQLESIYNFRPDLRTASEVPDDVAQKRQRVQELRSRISTLQRQLLDETMAAGGIDPRDSQSLERLQELRRAYAEDLIAATAEEAQRNVLSSRIGEYESNLRRIPTQQIELAQRQRERQATERLYLALKERHQEASVAEESELGYAEQVRPALRSTVPVAPNRPLSIGLGLMMGLILGIGVTLLRERLDHRLHTPEDLRERGLSVLGVVPDLVPFIKREFGGQEFISVEGQRLSTRLTALLNPLSPASESYRSLRTSIEFSRPDTPIRTLVVTSSVPGEGKSITALNMAVAMAQSGRRVVVVDCDLRKPSVHTKMGIPREPGVVDLLFQRQHFDLEAFATPYDDLYIIPAGVAAPNPAELLGSRALSDLLELLRNSVDMVIVDSPPVLVATDSSILAARCDATVLVVSAGRTRDYEVDQSLEALRAVSVQPLGVVLNRLDLRQTNGYGYRYAYRYAGYKEGGYGHGDGAASVLSASPTRTS